MVVEASQLNVKIANTKVSKFVNKLDDMVIILNYNIDFKYIDRFFGYNVFNSHFKLNLKMTDSKLSYDYKLFIDEEDNSFNQKYDIKEKNNITLNSIGTSQKVYDLYLDSLDYDKHSVNYKRVPLTNQY